MNSELVRERKQKLASWKAAGFGYATKFERTHTAQKAREAVQETPPRDTKTVLSTPVEQARVCGRLIAKRDMGKLAFLRLRDATGDFQICFSAGVLGNQYSQWLKLLDLGDFCGFHGEFFLTKHGEPTLLATEVVPLSKSLLPLPEKFHGVTNREQCYRQRYLDLATNTNTFRRFQIRSEVVRAIRRFLDDRDFQEVETRILQPQAGGAMAKVFSTHHNALDREFVLRIALELDLKMLTAGGMERVYEIGKCFRNEGTDPSHLQEFTMLEWYAAYADMQDNMAWTEEMIKTVLKQVVGTTEVEILTKDETRQAVDFGKAWPRVEFGDLLQEYAGIDMATVSPEALDAKCRELGMSDAELSTTGRGNKLDFVYKKTARPHLIEPTFVMGYPSDLKPLARPKEDGTAECYQLLVGGWEIVNAYGELIDPMVQRALLEKQAEAKAAGDEETMDVDEVFLTAMEHGFPPMTGFGMGIDRFVALITGQPNLRDVVLFPLMRPE